MTDTYRPLVRTQADLEEVWRFLMRPLGFGRRSVWLLHLGADRRPTPVLTEITDCADRPEPDHAAGLAATLRELDRQEPGGSVAFLVSRPGRGVVDRDDVAWAVFLHETGREAGVRQETVHLATDDDVVAIPLDDLLPRSA
ncbi:hypothetical protein [Nocardioides mangrovi]|uniref:DUF695 domain-containing protein n=1 Tax=Nocardioides mangrovi TaxID=2874580 RepID=A0ABS7U9H6_9ACTN|nr:hypothetical protein [Nocardioides mangrovi]MBZ5737628.1 hypothetical protein [Nocardioides mangrovi]